MGRIVVGYDGSPTSLAALRWALDEAAVRDADVEVVHSWVYPATGALPLGPHLPAPELVDAEAETLIAQGLDAAGAATTGRASARAMRGSAAASLLRAAEGAELLVVGSRGRGGFAGLLLGSVSQQCVIHAPCPVVVVPTAGDDETA